MGCRAVQAVDLASGLRSGAAVSAVRRPSDAAVLEVQSDAVAVVHEFLAIDNLSADRDFIFQASNLRNFANLPRAAGNHAGTVSTEVIRISQFCCVDRPILRLVEAHNYGDW